MRAGLTLVLVVLVGNLVAAGGASAQLLNPRGRPNYGTRPLGPGFTPDPISVPVLSGGNVNVSALGIGQGCTGYASPNPDFQFTLMAPTLFMRIFVDAGQEDTTLIIARADGGWSCADDTYGVNPGIDLVNAQTGVYNVWVGSYREGERVRGTFAVTGQRNIHPPGDVRPPTPVPAPVPTPPRPPVNVPLNATGRPNFGQRRVNPGFHPDPMRIRITSGGSIGVRDLGLGAGCTGFVTAQPDFIMQLTGPSPSLRVYVNEARDNADTTLIIQRPDGTWICNDDSNGGTSPTVDLDNADRGNYAIWIGSYEASVQARARLNITEIRSNHP